MEEILSIRIKGDVSDLAKSGNEADTVLSNIGKSAEKASQKAATAFTGMPSVIGRVFTQIKSQADFSGISDKFSKVSAQILSDSESIQRFSDAINTYLKNLGAAPDISLGNITNQIDALEGKISQSRAVLSITTDPTSIQKLTVELNTLETELANLQNQSLVLKTSDVITQFNAINNSILTTQQNIARIETELQGLKINVSADPSKIVVLETELKTLKTNLTELNSQKISLQADQGFAVINELNTTIDSLQAKIQANKLKLNVETNPISIQNIKDEIASLEGNVQGLKNISVEINTGSATKTINELSHTIETLRGKALANKDFIVTEKDITKIAKYNKEIEELEDQISRLQNIGKSGFNNLGQRVDKFGNSLTKLNKQNGAATQSLVNLSRVAQDAPFGFIGIANNLNPLLESFQRLRQESGSNVSALKSLGSALIGPAGIGLALGIISSLLITFGDKIFKSKTAAESQADAIKKASQMLRDYEASLNDISKVNLLGTQNAQGEIVKLKAIYDATQNTNLSLQTRKKLVDQLQEQYPKYFKNISDETILAGGAKTAYDQLTQSILASSRARAAQDTLVEIQKDLLTTEQQLADAQTARNTSLNKLNKTVERSKQIQKGVIGGSSLGVSTVNTQDVKAANELEKKQKDINALYDKRFELQRRINSVSALLTDIVVKNPEAISTGDLKDVKTPKIKIKPEKAEVDIRGVRVETLGIEVLRNELQQGHEFDKLFQLKPKTLSIDFKETKIITNISDKVLKEFASFIKSPASIVSPEVKEQLSEYEKGMVNLADTVSSLVTPAFQNMFAAILAGENPIKSFFDSLGQSVTQFMQKLIGAAIQAALLSAILPGGAGAVKGFSGFFKKALGFASGGLAFGPTLGLVGEGRGTTRSNPEVIAPLNKLSQFIGGGSTGDTLVTRISGNDLELLLVRNGKRNGRVR